MTTYTVDQVVAKYIELRDKKAEMAAEQKVAMEPISQALEQMEAWLLAKMNTDGVDSFKTQSGTAFKARTSSVSMQDAVAFKSFVFSPVLEQLKNYLISAVEVELEPHDFEHINTMLQDAPLWSLTDFRAGKKGIQEYVEEKQSAVPGVTLNPILTVNIRRA